MARPMLLDVDTGIDDAVAIGLAARIDTHELVALTTVAGNVPIEYSTINTQRVAAWFELDVPIYRGMSEPLARPLVTAIDVMGHNGLGGWEPPVSPRPIQPETAPEAIVRHARENRGEITFVFVGPLTNLAVALSLEPEIAEWVDRLVIMGGAFFVPGNTTPVAEFNILVDPEAAAKVARSRMRTTWVPLDVTHQAGFTLEQWVPLATRIDPGGVLVREVMRRTLSELRKPRFHLHDLLAVAVASDEAVVGVETGEVLIDTGAFTRGQTRLAQGSLANADHGVATTLDAERFNAIFSRMIDV